MNKVALDKKRYILHCDMNSFYASVEMMLEPQLKDKAVAVCGSDEERHGVVLAKSELAKTAGVKTGMTTWEAEQLCPNLIKLPPQFNEYLKYSKLARSLYEEYTDLVEPYGMDECFLDITNSAHLYGGPIAVAESLRSRVKSEFGLTISIGLSYNKVLAKMGSDMKKPDAITIIGPKDIETKIWPLPIASLFCCGKATSKKLISCSIKTIGDLAKSEKNFIGKLLGRNGIKLWQYANGIDDSKVKASDVISIPKSISHGITCIADLENIEEIWKVMLELSQDVGAKLRVDNLKAKGVQITLRHADLHYEQKQGKLKNPSRVPYELALKGIELAKKLQLDGRNILPTRSVTIRAINLTNECRPVEISLFDEEIELGKREKVFEVVDDLRKKFGKEIVREAVLLENNKVAKERFSVIKLPGQIET